MADRRSRPWSRSAWSFLKAEVLNAFSSRRVALVLTVAAFLTAATLYIRGLTEIRWFLALAYVFIPVLLLPVYTARTPAERQTQFALVLYTYPVSQRQYFWSRFVLNVLIGLAYVAVTLVFTLPIVWFAGPYWWTLLPVYLALGLGVIAATSAVGLLLGSVLGGHKMLTAGFIGFLVSLVAFFAPRIVLMVETLEPEAVRLTLMRALHVFPTVPAAIMLPIGSYPVVGDELVQMAVLPGLVVLFLLLGYRAYVGLQGPEGWKVGPGRVAAFSVLAAGLLLAPALTPVDYGRPDPVLIRDTDTDLRMYANLFLFLVPEGGGEPRESGAMTQGVSYSKFVALQVRRNVAEDSNLTNVQVTLSSELLGIEEETATLGDVPVPGTASGGASGEERGGQFVGVPIDVPVHVRSVPGLVGSEPARVVAEVTAQETSFTLVHDEIHITPAVGSPPRWSPFLLAGVVSLLAWGFVGLQRRRNR